MHRAREELAAAGLLADHGFPAQAVSRSYYAALYMAEEALQRVGVARSKHAGVVAAVARVLVREYGLDPQSGRLLRSLFERRSRADYNVGDTPPSEAAQAVADARVVVATISEWLSGLDTTPGGPATNEQEQ